MAAAARKISDETTTRFDGRKDGNGRRLAALACLAGADIETPLIANLSRDLHSLFDPVADGVLPIYFGPLLGRLYLENL